MEPMDNFLMHLKSCDFEKIEKALNLIITSGISAWSEEGDWLVFYWYEASSTNKFPSKLKSQDLVSIIQKWLSEHPPSNKSDYNNFDGSISKGFEILANRGTPFYEEFRVRSIWAEHHK